MDGSNFPMFSDGDVKIWIDHNTYQLHSGVLGHRSHFFKHALRVAPRFEGFIHFNLVPSEMSEVGILAAQESDSSPPLIESLFDNPIKVREYWENILRTLYRIKPKLHLLGLGPATVALDLADLGESIGSKAIVDEGIDRALQGLGQELFLMVSWDPVRWLLFGSRIRSGTIYREAMIHLVGKWPQLTDDDHVRVSLLPGYTLDLLHDLCAALREAKEAAETLLSCYSSDWLSADDFTYYCSDTSMVQAAGIFRTWFAQEMARGNNLINWDGGTRLIRTIAAGGEAYLGNDRFEFFRGLPLQGFGETDEIENGLDIIKNGAKQIVAPLLINESQYDPRQLGQLPYLTCVKIEIEAIPWDEWAFEDANNDWSETESSESGSISDDSWSSVANLPYNPENETFSSFPLDQELAQHDQEVIQLDEDFTQLDFTQLDLTQLDLTELDFTQLDEELTQLNPEVIQFDEEPIQDDQTEGDMSSLFE